MVGRAQPHERMVVRTILLGVWLTAVLSGRAAPVDFKHDVEPILVKRCSECHGADQQKAGLPSGAGDAGRFRVTQREADRHVFKVPGLRNVALTAPYFHDGSAATLEEAVEVMFRYQLGRPAPAEDRALIVKFLNSLTGDRFLKTP